MAASKGERTMVPLRLPNEILARLDVECRARELRRNDALIAAVMGWLSLAVVMESVPAGPRKSTIPQEDAPRRAVPVLDMDDLPVSVGPVPETPGGRLKGNPLKVKK